jgi:hypothetical protein
MRSFRPGWFLPLALALGAALVCTGCPELNRQPDHSVGPFFSVDDPAGRAPTLGPTQVVISEKGGLPDQSRRAH